MGALSWHEDGCWLWPFLGLVYGAVLVALIVRFA
jgi:hypothetical protein